MHLCKDQANVVRQADDVQSCEDQVDVQMAGTKSAKNKWRFTDKWCFTIFSHDIGLIQFSGPGSNYSNHTLVMKRVDQN